MASYYSYIGLTHNLKNEDGSLTKYGIISRNGIIISCLVSLLAFIADANISKNKPDELSEEFNNVNYPLDGLSIHGKTTSIYVKNTVYSDDFLIWCLTFFNIWRDKSKPAYKNSFLSVPDDKNGKATESTLFFDSLGKPSYIDIDTNFVVKNGFYKKLTQGPEKAIEGNIYFTTLTDSSQFDKFKSYKSLHPNQENFDLVIHPEFESLERCFYYPEKDKIVFFSKYRLTITKNNGRIKNLKDLSNAFAFVSSNIILNPTQYTYIQSQKGYKLKNIFAYNYNLSSQLIKNIGTFYVSQFKFE